MERQPHNNSHQSKSTNRSYTQEISKFKQPNKQMQDLNQLIPIINRSIKNSNSYDKKNFSETKTSQSYYPDQNIHNFIIPQKQSHNISDTILDCDLNDSSQQIHSILAGINQKLHPSVIKAIETMKIPINTQALDKATESHHSLKDRKDFTYDEGTGLYSIDYASEKIMPFIGQAYINRLKTTNLYLMNKIEIGPFIKYDKLESLFQVHFESLQHLVLERNWKEGQQHGFDFFRNTENLKNIRRLTLKGNYFSPKFMEEKSIFNLPKLEFLELNFEEEMKNQEIYDLIENIARYNYQFMVRIWTSKPKEQFKKGDLQIHFHSLDIKSKNEKQGENEIFERKQEVEVNTTQNSSCSEKEGQNQNNVIRDVTYNSKNEHFKSDFVVGFQANTTINQDEAKEIEIKNPFSKGIKVSGVRVENQGGTYEKNFIIGAQINTSYNNGSKKT